ncbi:MAG: hypothetical protein U9N34_02880 [Candidatus Cloacimonadota bacterium]|nr:hypothetical protein [Candidatus Cloacimonadota bacterium]
MNHKKILSMIDSGKITATEGAHLISAMNSVGNRKTPKKLFFEINDDKNNPIVKFSIPLKLLKFGINVIPKDANLKVNFGNEFDFSSINWKELIEIANNEKGDIFNLEVDSQSGGSIRIHIFIE